MNQVNVTVSENKAKALEFDEESNFTLIIPSTVHRILLEPSEKDLDTSTNFRNIRGRLVSMREILRVDREKADSKGNGKTPEKVSCDVDSKPTAKLLATKPDLCFLLRI